MKNYVSIIIPVYNMEKYLYECLESVFNQTYKNIEVIIVNDGSNDNSEYIIEEFLKRYKNIIYIKQENSGLSIARNNGLKHVKGKFVMFLDSDDYLEINCIELLYKKSFETNCDMVIMGHRKVYENNIKPSEIYCVKYIDDRKVYTGKYVSDMILKSDIQGYSCDKLIKTSKLKKTKLYYEPNRYIEDLYPIFKLIYSCEKICFINKPLYNYRQLKTSISHKKTEKLIEDYAYANDKVLKYLNKKNSFEKDNIIHFRYEFFRTIIGMMNEYNNKKYRIYKMFKDKGLKKYEPTIKEIFKCNAIKLTSKIDIILWKLRIYNILMPELIRFKKYIECVFFRAGDKESIYG